VATAFGAGLSAAQPTVDPADRSSPDSLRVAFDRRRLTTMALKTVAHQLTGSVGLLSDAVESLVNSPAR
jgi:hypothetical protein